MTEQQVDRFMRDAIQEGRNARDVCHPNPPVGCVLVRHGEIVARGHTNEPGQPHAEAMALSQVREASGTSAFVTLEPCSFHGRTPSCAKALVQAGVSAVYVGILDPDPRNDGAGIAILEAAGIPVHVGILAHEVHSDLDPYLNRASPPG